MTRKPFVVVFGGVPGSSKSIIAYHLSTTFNLPIFSSDNIRFEVKEDLLLDDINIPLALQEYEKRRKARWDKLLSEQRSFIVDASMDRSWEDNKRDLGGNGYRWFFINMELSKDFLMKLYQKTGRQEAVEELDAYIQQHMEFINKYSQDITVSVTDATFGGRLQVTEAALREFLGTG